MKNFLFPKFFPNMNARELAQYCLSLGIDGPTLLIRNGYPVQPDNISETLPQFVAQTRSCGAEIIYADTPYDMQDLDTLDDALALMQDNGIRLFRVNYIPKSMYSARELHDVLCRGMEKAENAARKYGIRAVIQLHGGMYPHNATGAYFACKQFDPAYIGIKLDPGNNIDQEGYESYAYQVELLGEYIAAIGQKDAILSHDAGTQSWNRSFAPANVGVNDYNDIFAQIKKQGLQIPGIFMPFYHENDINALKAAFIDEVAYIKRCQENNGL